MTDFTKNKTFCVLPWKHLATAPDGAVRPCCVNNDNFKRSDGTDYNLGYDNIEDIYNSPDIRTLRRLMVAGESIDGCKVCYQAEKNSDSSLRLHRNSELNHDTKLKEKILSSIENDYHTTHDVNYIDFRFGNLCNLKCRCCDPINSSQLQRESSEIRQYDIKINNYLRIVPDNINDWYQTDKFWDNYNKIKDSLTEVYLTGGEPTIIDANYKMLETLIDENRSKDITLIFNTNLTNVNPRFINVINKFKFTYFLCSVEGTGVVQEYLRFPSKWSAIESNFKKLLDSVESAEIRLTPVVQTINLNSITDLFEWAEQFNRERGYLKVKLSPIVLTGPEHLAIENLPHDYKISCLNKIQQWVQTKLEYQNHEFLEIVRQIEDRCTTKNYYLNHLSRLAEYTSILDKHRNQSLKDVNSELYDILYG